MFEPELLSKRGQKLNWTKNLNKNCSSRLTFESLAVLYLNSFLGRSDYQYTRLGSIDLTAGLLS